MAFPIQHQLETEWCWDAAAVSIMHYFDPASKLTQLAFAQRTIPPKDAADPPGLDRPFYLQDALSDLGLIKEPILDGFMPFSQIQEQLDLNLPVCVTIEWFGGEGVHYALITGYGISPAGDAQIYISDPILSDGNVTVWDYNAFVFAYSPSYTAAEGEWVETFLVKAIPAAPASGGSI